MSKINVRQRRPGVRIWTLVALLVGTLVVAFAWLGLSAGSANAQKKGSQFTSDFRLAECTFSATGANTYFILNPGYRLVFEGQDKGDTTHLEITVLNETKDISLPDIGTVTTSVVEERESVNGELAEVSRNWFAICAPTNDVFYFGEDVDIYNEDGTITHEGAWQAGVNGAMPGIIMPGRFLLGSRYYQEQAPGVAEDRSENVEMGLTVDTPAGTFEGCVKVLETTPLERGTSEKIYCPGVGLTVDSEVQLVSYGSSNGGGNDDGGGGDSEHD